MQAQPGYGPALCVLGLIDAALGRKEEALSEGRRAIELLPVEKDSTDGSQMLVYFAIIAAWVGEKDTALQYLETNVQSPGGHFIVTYGALSCCPSGTRSAAIRASRKSSPRLRQRRNKSAPMVTDQSSEVKFEIGHVLFIDIVGYSKLLINEQSDQIQRVKGIVRQTGQFRLAV